MTVLDKILAALVLQIILLAIFYVPNRGKRLSRRYTQISILIYLIDGKLQSKHIQVESADEAIFKNVRRPFLALVSLILLSGVYMMAMTVYREYQLSKLLK